MATLLNMFIFFVIYFFPIETYKFFSLNLYAETL